MKQSNLNLILIGGISLLLTPLAFAESTSTISTDSQSNVTNSVRVNGKDVSGETKSNSMRVRTIRRNGSGSIGTQTNSTMISNTTCRKERGTERTRCFQSLRTQSSPRTQIINEQDFLLEEDAGDWLTQCRMMFGQENMMCNEKSDAASWMKEWGAKDYEMMHRMFHMWLTMMHRMFHGMFESGSGTLVPISNMPSQSGAMMQLFTPERTWMRMLEQCKDVQGRGRIRCLRGEVREWKTQAQTMQRTQSSRPAQSSLERSRVQSRMRMMQGTGSTLRGTGSMMQGSGY